MAFGIGAVGAGDWTFVVGAAGAMGMVGAVKNDDNPRVERLPRLSDAFIAIL
jgi:hypothetical protein